jgi:hypothetical protein
MKGLQLNLLIICCVILAKSCETTEKIDEFPLRPSKLVLNCFFTADSTWEFQVSNSLSVLDNAQIELIDSASILLFQDGYPIDTLDRPEDDGIYRSHKVLPGMNASYSVTATAPGFDVVLHAEDHVPVSVPIRRIRGTIIDSSFYHGYDYYTDSPKIRGHIEGTIELEIQDPPGVDNYYHLAVYFMEERLRDYEDTIYYLDRRRVNFTVQDAAAEETAFGSGALFSDQFFDGQEHTVKIIYHASGIKNNMKVFYAELTSLTESAYLYKRSIEDYQAASGDPFSEPVLVYGNIENGLGIFSGYNLNADSLVIF